MRDATTFLTKVAMAYEVIISVVTVLIGVFWFMTVMNDGKTAAVQNAADVTPQAAVDGPRPWR